MPTTASRARRWIKSGEATPFFRRGIFCVRLNREPSGYERQPVAVGVDPGSKKEGYTVKSAAHTYLNVQADAVFWVKGAMETRRNMRGARRSRKTPCRAPRPNRHQGRALGCPPSTKARWQWKLRILAQFAKMFPITDVVVEDISAKTRRFQRKWNRSFSPLEVGKAWFYDRAMVFGALHVKTGFDTFTMREALGLRKTSSKMSETFAAHCVDSWVLANWCVGGHVRPEHERIVCISPIRVHRRQLHRLQPGPGGVRSPYGGTRSCGFKRGSLVKHSKWGLAYVGGTVAGRVSLHDFVTGKRIAKNAKPAEIRFRSYSAWQSRAGRIRRTTTGLLPALKSVVPAPEIDR